MHAMCVRLKSRGQATSYEYLCLICGPVLCKPTESVRLEHCLQCLPEAIVNDHTSGSLGAKRRHSLNVRSYMGIRVKGFMTPQCLKAI